ncbi:hypothetical protein [Niallia sp. FSL W8-0635]|uniref:hypothetical protein n=1 Tax=Niallia sp. FSL W8-0635 TaxID=2975337 RepID=UPI002B03B2C3|nr:hypothetical protein [Yersinia enterocolitica]
MESGENIVEFFLESTKMLIITAYELTKEKQVDNRGELWQFFKHVRNACAHGGSFHFIGNEPKYIAKWRAKEINSSLQGRKLFNQGTLG